MKLFLCMIAASAIWFQFFRPAGMSQAFPAVDMRQATGARELPMSERQRVVLITGTQWSQASRLLHETVASRPEWIEFAQKEIQFVTFDLPRDPANIAPQVQQVMKQYGVKTVPTMLIIGRDNQKIDHVTGAGKPVENYKKWVRGYAFDVEKK